jgi:hypothetical protein
VTFCNWTYIFHQWATEWGFSVVSLAIKPPKLCKKVD